MRGFSKKYNALSLRLDTAYEGNDLEFQLAYSISMIEDALFEIDRAQALIMSGDTGLGLDVLEGLKYQFMRYSLDALASRSNH